MNRYQLVLLLIHILWFRAYATPNSSPSYLKEIENKATGLVAQMTLVEKLDMIHGERSDIAPSEDRFYIAPVPRLGIPSINMSDASMGLHVNPWPYCKGLEPSTAFPASLLLASTWDPDMAYRYATAVAEEFRARNINILLGPGINIYRNPLCGRNYEYMGEDPYLVSRMVVPYVKAVRDVGCIPVVKHFVANHSEPKRKASNSVVDERALREIYFPGFKAAVKEGETLGVMSAYNLLNGTYCGESKWLLKDVLRGEWGFRGMIISDWTSIWHPELAVNSGVDIEMPGGIQSFALTHKRVKQLLAEDKTTRKEIDSKVYHLIRSCLEMNMYADNWDRPELNTLDKHAQVALQTAREGMVLLQNRDHLLPLEPKNVRNIVVMGSTARKTPTTGGGSGGVRPENPISIWNGIHKIYGDKAELLEEFDAQKLKNADAVIVCVGYNTGLKLKDYRKKDKRVERAASNQATSSESACQMKNLDTSERESVDRGSYSLPKGDDELIELCASANPNTVVLYTAGAGIAMPWVDRVKGILWMIYPGQNGSIAAAEIVAGKTNPSGKLPITIEKRLKDNAAFGHFSIDKNNPVKGPAIVHWNVPYHNGAPLEGAAPLEHWDIDYSEGIFVGYRHMDKEKIEPRFCFGHGLSYTTFKYDNLRIKKKGKGQLVSFDLTNVGNRAGADVVQVYVGDPECSVPRPPKELKGFEKIRLVPGETKCIKLLLDRDAFSFWSPETKNWIIEPGRFDILVGSSSRDIRLKDSVTF